MTDTPETETPTPAAEAPPAAPAEAEATAPAAPFMLYNLGAGSRRVLKGLPEGSPLAGWTEVCVDLNPAGKPDILADLTALDDKIADGVADLVFLSHVIEHFYDHQVDGVLASLARIVKPDGAVIFKTPDLVQIARLITEDELERDIYQSPAGPIRVLDVIYGHRASVARGDVLMAHKTGFTERSLADRLLAAGFAEVRTVRGPSVDLHAVATKGETPHKKQINALLKL